MKSLCKWPNVFVSAGLLAFTPVGLLAQETTTLEADKKPTANKSAKPVIEEQIVTGTSLRGVEVTGTNPTVLGEQEITSAGAMNGTLLLSTMPQMKDFGTPTAVKGRAGTSDTANSPNIRNLPEGGGASPTLMLVDGHRIVGVGVSQVAPDADVLAPIVLQRVEVMADGGSSTYGADAVGGVVNYITRKQFEGVEIRTRYGFADDYHTEDASILAGGIWGDISAYIAYNKSHHSALYGKDRDYVKRQDWTTGIPLDTECNPGNVNIRNGSSVTNYALPGLVSNTANRCDYSGNKTIFPSEDQDNVFAAFTANLSERVEFDLRAWYSARTNESDDGDLHGSATMRSTNPYYRSVGGANAGLPQTVQFSFAPALGTHAWQEQNVDVIGVTPTLKVDLGHDWEMRTLLNYGKSETTVSNAAVNTTALAAAAASTNPATALNPYNIAATNPAVLNNIKNYQTYGQGISELTNVRAAFDGPLFKIPGGEVQLAIGSEYMHQKFEQRAGNAVFGGESSLPEFSNTRSVGAGYVELRVPLVGDSNKMFGVHSLTLSLADRYDHYSDFGSTNNGKIGVNYEPVEWLALRSTWSQSFQAPALSVMLPNASLRFINSIAVLRDPNTPPPPAPYYEIFATGGNADLKPQTAETLTYGFDLLPPAIPGLKVSATYYTIEFEDQVRAPDPFSPTVFQDYPTLAMSNPTQQQVLDLASAVPGGVAQVQALPSGVPIYTIFDGRVTNLAQSEVSGFDFSISYDRDTAIGSLFTSIGGTYVLNERNAPKSGSFGDDLSDFDKPNFKTAASMGLRRGAWLTNATVNYLDSFKVTSSQSNAFQSEVASWWGLDLYTQYSFTERADALSGVTVSLSVNNALDRDPAVYRGLFQQSFEGYANPRGGLGRLVQFGVNKRF